MRACPRRGSATGAGFSAAGVKGHSTVGRPAAVSLFNGMMRNIGAREMSPYDSRIKLEALRDQFETFSKAGNYLLIAHSAGLVGCLSVVKDHPEKLPAQLQGIGQLVLLFGCGLLSGVLLWGVAMAIKISVTQAIISQQELSQSWLPWLYRKLIAAIAHIGLWGSLAAFVGAIILIMSQFTDAIPAELMAWFRRSRS
jgi:hypothetical protein